MVTLWCVTDGQSYKVFNFSVPLFGTEYKRTFTDYVLGSWYFLVPVFGIR